MLSAKTLETSEKPEHRKITVLSLHKPKLGNLLVEIMKRWKAGLEEKGLRVNMGKTMVMRCRDEASQV